MLVATVRYCMLLDCESFIQVGFIPLFVIHVWDPRFPLSANKEVLDFLSYIPVGSLTGRTPPSPPPPSNPAHDTQRSVSALSVNARAVTTTCSTPWLTANNVQQLDTICAQTNTYFTGFGSSTLTTILPPLGPYTPPPPLDHHSPPLHPPTLTPILPPLPPSTLTPILPHLGPSPPPPLLTPIFPPPHLTPLLPPSSPAPPPPRLPSSCTPPPHLLSFRKFSLRK